MKIIPFDTVVDSVARLVVETNCRLPDDVLERIVSMRGKETDSLAISILDQIIENAHIASTELLPLCQDTGTAVFFVEVGDMVRVDGGGLEAAINKGTSNGYTDGKLRMSMLEDPLRRRNTGDNTPAIIHYNITSGETLSIVACPKGGGCENMSRLTMLTPGDGRRGVCDFVVETVSIGGGKPCPPVIVGVGIGGNFESSALLAKRSLLRPVGERNGDPYYAELEQELLARINDLGIGPMGLGGYSTALDVFVESAPCHIASLPVAVNIQCHAARHGKIVL